MLSPLRKRLESQTAAMSTQLIIDFFWDAPCGVEHCSDNARDVVEVYSRRKHSGLRGSHEHMTYLAAREACSSLFAGLREHRHGILHQS